MRATVGRIAVFLTSFALLQAMWVWSRGSWVERLWIEDLTVRFAVAIVGWFSPAIGAVGEGSRIVAAGGGLNILAGCEGVEVVFLMLAAFIAFPASARVRLLGIATGVVFVFLLNEVRILALFYAFRNNRPLFNFLHTVGAPLLMVALTGLFFHAWTAQARRPAERANLSSGEMLVGGDTGRGTERPALNSGPK
jgi:exosortase/archaeosortase family protein